MSLASLWLLFFSGYVHLRAKKPLDFIMTALLITLSFGILWELFEYLVGPDLTTQNYFSDTFVDLIMDVSGSLIGYFLFYFMKYEAVALSTKYEIRSTKK